ncbi:MAG: hypothetical protein LBH41_02180 [Rickettsiales bacterium]|jgi:uncharacterized membrane protein YhaH (DUF805 family)|nr:hypothetical protein [Rickettsiales bacterium]
MAQTENAARTKNNSRHRYYRGSGARHGGGGGKAGSGAGRSGVKGKGLFGFFFGFTGAISKELYLGATVVFEILTIGLMALQSLLPETPAGAPVANPGAYYAIMTAMLVLFVSNLSYGYRRAHALGISGFYSIVGGTLFLPFFAFWRADRDGANDGAYRRQIPAFKKLGAVLGRNIWTQMALISVIFAVLICSNAHASGQWWNQPQVVTACAWAFNMVQVLVAGRRFAFMRRFYSNAVKVVSFFAYNAIVIFVTAGVVAQMMLAAMLQALQK